MQFSKRFRTYQLIFLTSPLLFKSRTDFSKKGVDIEWFWKRINQMIYAWFFHKTTSPTNFWFLLRNLFTLHYSNFGCTLFLLARGLLSLTLLSYRDWLLSSSGFIKARLANRFSWVIGHHYYWDTEYCKVPRLCTLKLRGHTFIT